MNQLPELSVFFPAYNEEANIITTVAAALRVLPRLAKKYEVIVVNDGSTDATAPLVQQFILTHPHVKLVNHPYNLGYGAALKTGMTKAKYNWICFTDSDGQFRFNEIRKFLPFIATYDLITGFRQKRTDSPTRRFLARLLRLWDTFLFGLNVKDVDCGFKLFKKQVIDTIGSLATASAITETEFMVKAQRAGFKIKEIGVTHHARPEGIQTGAKLGVIFKAFVESFKLLQHLNTVPKKSP